MDKETLRYIDSPLPAFLEVEEGKTLHLEVAYFASPLMSGSAIHVAKDAHLQMAIADFSDKDDSCHLEIELEEGASAEIHVAVLGKGMSKKTYMPNVNHKGGHSEALVSSYGIATDASQLSFLGISTIQKGSKGAATRQEAKVIIFDQEAKGAASPVLRIYENDVKASHGASIGRLNDHHLFYLESRGLSEKEAKRLITLGYLKPIIPHFEEESLRERIADAIEGGVSYDR